MADLLLLGSLQPIDCNLNSAKYYYSLNICSVAFFVKSYQEHLVVIVKCWCFDSLKILKKVLHYI